AASERQRWTILEISVEDDVVLLHFVRADIRLRGEAGEARVVGHAVDRRRPALIVQRQQRTVVSGIDGRAVAHERVREGQAAVVAQWSQMRAEALQWVRWQVRDQARANEIVRGNREATVECHGTG